MTTEIQLSDWAAVTSEIQQFGSLSEVTTGDDHIRVDFGRAYLEVKKEGAVSTGMPLHEFEHDGEGKLIVDHENDSITVITGSVEYTFRRP